MEDILLRHPGVADVAVVGAPDEQWGEILVAIVSARKGRRPKAKGLQDFVGERLSRHKKPKAVFFLPELPRNAQGKVLKKELRKRLAAGEFPLP